VPTHRGKSAPDGTEQDELLASTFAPVGGDERLRPGDTRADFRGVSIRVRLDDVRQ